MLSTMYVAITQAAANGFIQTKLDLPKNGAYLQWACLILNREGVDTGKFVMCICREKNEATVPSIQFSGNIILPWIRSIILPAGQGIEYPETEFFYLGGIPIVKPYLWFQFQTWNYVAAATCYFIVALEDRKGYPQVAGQNVGINR